MLARSSETPIDEVRVRRSCRDQRKIACTMNLSGQISELWSIYVFPSVFPQFAFALGYLNCSSLSQRSPLDIPKMKKEILINVPSGRPSTISPRDGLSDPNMKKETFTELPSEIISDILSRLSVRTVVNCMCVCKSWLNLVRTREFVKSHLSNSVPGLIVFDSTKGLYTYKVFELEDGLDLERHDRHYNSLTKFKLPFYGGMRVSVHGLVFLHLPNQGPKGLYLWNPITRDYIKLHCPQKLAHSYSDVVTYGFGVSKTTGQYKLVRISHNCIKDLDTEELLEITESECRVYTLGTGSWRSIAPSVPLDYHCSNSLYSDCKYRGEFEGNHGVFVNGNLHWLASDLQGSPQISCIDLETEVFSSFSSPTLPNGRGKSTTLFALGDRLGLCDNTSRSEIVIWMMKEYGVERSWSKEYVISNIPDFAYECYDACYSDFPEKSYAVYPIKFFKNGDILMTLLDIFPFYYSNKTKATKKLDMFEQHTPADSIFPILHTPSFLSLRSFDLEDVRSF